jgi:alpha-L-fucosidase
MLDSVFQNNLAAGSAVTSGSFRGRSSQFKPANLTDGNKETYWSTNDDVLTEYLEITLDKAQTIEYIIIQEYIKLGQRITSFNVEILHGKDWIKVAEGTTIGYKRILKTDPVSATRIRLNITGAKACPVLSNVEVY